MVILSMKSELEMIAELVPVNGTLQYKEKTFIIPCENARHYHDFEAIFEDKLRRLVVFIFWDRENYSREKRDN